MFDLNYATWAVDIDGATVRKLADAYPGVGDEWWKGQYGHYADVSPDGSRIVYSTCEHTYYDHDKVGWQYNLGYEIASVNVDGSDRQRLTDNLHFENYPVWSPDGTRIAFIAHNDYRFIEGYDYPSPEHYDTYNSEIFTRSSDGKDERVVPNTKGAELDPVDGPGPPGHPGTRGVGLYPPVWSPDGERLAFTAHEGRRARYGNSGELERILYTVRLDGSELSRIGKATTLPTWSPDGERVAFGLDDVVYTVRFDGTDLREVLDDFMAHEVSWSPDGAELLLASDGGVHVVHPDGSGLRRLGPSVPTILRTTNARTTNATWSPDGSMIAARREEEVQEVGRYGVALVIFVMDRDGTDVRFLADGYISSGGYDEEETRVRPIAATPIDPETCSNGVAVAQPEVTPGLVEDCKALVRSRDALGPRATSGWTTDAPISEWPSVFVSGDPPRVRNLHISRDVIGTIPADIGKLTMLERLSIIHSDLLIGAIPPELGNLTRLTYLFLGHNNLSGAIPPELGNLTELRLLILRHNNLSGPIPSELGNLTMLEEFDLSRNPLSGCIPAALSHLWFNKNWIPICKP